MTEDELRATVRWSEGVVRDLAVRNRAADRLALWVGILAGLVLVLLWRVL